MTARLRESGRAWAARATGFITFWLILTSFNLADLPIGAMASALATWASLRLLPAGQWSIRPVALARLVLRFLNQSVRAGIDVARRALDPQLPLQPGFARYPSRLPRGLRRNAFCTMTSLLPGTLPCSTEANGDLTIHCLDLSQPVAEQLATEEAIFVRTFGSADGHD
jgi:multicomponent Na+:H+ antiporter subunit E